MRSSEIASSETSRSVSSFASTGDQIVRTTHFQAMSGVIDSPVGGVVLPGKRLEGGDHALSIEIMGDRDFDPGLSNRRANELGVLGRVRQQPYRALGGVAHHQSHPSA
jgi:hypothetical protein